MASALISVNGSNRPFSNFTPTPSLWGDHFFNYISHPQIKEKYSKAIEKLKNEVRIMLTTQGGKMVDTMNLIETLERLGISYHFGNQIEEKIQQFFNLNTDYSDEAYDLYTVALHFRLFRQHGYPISSDIFRKWIDGNGKFQESLKRDAKGLLSLYEASHLRIHGETLLDDALDFARTNLKSMAPNLGSPLRKQVEHALFQSLHFGFQRVESRHFICIYEEEQHKNENLLRFAKLDFNLLQILHKEELREVSRWWKELDLISKLPYTRDRIVEGFFWSFGLHHEPQYSRIRIMLAKTVAMLTILDDTIDSYGTIEELDLLNEAIQRWDIKEIDRLPEYIKPFYKALLKLYQQFEEELAKEGRAYAAHYVIDALKETTMSYCVEAKWFKQGYVPPFEEYLNNGLITAASKYMNVTSMMGMESITKEDYEWLREKHKIIVATQTITRLINDIGSYEVEKEKGQVGSGIECYMKDKGVTKEEAMKKFFEMATNAWKDTNEECLRLSSNSRDAFMVSVFLNFNRLMDVSYKNEEDGYTKPEKVFKPLIIALLVDQIEI